MKRISVLLVLTLILFNGLYSQEKNTSKEIGIYFSNPDAFGIRYKFGNEKRMFRLTALSLSIGNTKNKNVNGSEMNVTQTYAGGGLNLGIEFPINITDNFNFYYGGELSGFYNHDKFNSDVNGIYKYNSYKAGIGFIAGFSYYLKSNVVLSAEIIPGFNYSNTENGTGKNTSFGFGLDSNAAGITLGYRF